MRPRLARLKRVLNTLRDDPFKAITRSVDVTRAQLFLFGCALGTGVCASGALRVVGPGRIHVGDRVTFVGGVTPTELICHPGGALIIGEESLFNYGVSVESHGAVTIGRRCMLASYVRICDGARDGPRPITIEDDVWLAHGVIVEPGVTIGAGSVVSAGSVVTRDVLPGSLAAGNPARCMSLNLAAPVAAHTAPRFS
ncbi:MAG: acyltransferase [Deltaproteobacteria bacterium]|nr:acyltransferase [Deltaproteobacteria bacterium]